MNVPVSLQLAAARLNMVAGEVSPAQLILLDGVRIVHLVRSLKGRRSVAEVFHMLSGGQMTVQGFASVWDGRIEVLAGLERMMPVMEDLGPLGDVDLLLLAFSKPELLSVLAQKGVHDDTMRAALQVMDPAKLRENLLVMGANVSLSRDMDSFGPDDAPRVLGALLWDASTSEAATHAPMALAFMAPVWRQAYVLAASAAPELGDADSALSHVENSLALSL